MQTYICGQRLTEDAIQSLLNHGRSGLIKEFKAKSGKKFSAYLVLNRENGEITFDFTSEAEKKLQCPSAIALWKKAVTAIYVQILNAGSKHLLRSVKSA